MTKILHSSSSTYTHSHIKSKLLTLMMADGKRMKGNSCFAICSLYVVAEIGFKVKHSLFKLRNHVLLLP